MAATTSHAATYRADISGYSATSPVWSILGIAPVSSAVFEFTFDETSPDTPTLIDTTDFELAFTQYEIASYRFELGSLVIESGPGVTQSEVFVRDGIESRNRPTFDYFQATMREDVLLSNGAIIDVIQVQVPTFALDTWSGLDVPSPDILNAQSNPSSFFQVYDNFGNRAGLFGRSVEFSSIGLAPVPLPSGAPLLLAGLAGLAVLRRRRSS